jgi:hypothetical protein
VTPHAAYGLGSYVASRKASVRNKTPKEKSAVGAKTKTAVGVAEAPYPGKKIIEDPDTEHGLTAIDSTYI